MEPNFTIAPQPPLETVAEDGQTPELPFRHRRAFSDFPLDVSGSLDDDMVFDTSDFDVTDFVCPPPSPSLLPLSESVGTVVDSGSRKSEPLVRSLSPESDDLIGAAEGKKDGGGKMAERRHRHRHRHSVSIDGSSTMSFQGMSSYLIKRAMPPEQLAELKRVDPVRAKRIVANRQSAARSKERKTRYISEMEKKLQDFQTESTNLTQRLIMLKKDTTNFTVLHEELKKNLQNMRLQSQIQAELDQTLKEEQDFLRKQTFQNEFLLANHHFNNDVMISHQFSTQLGIHQVLNSLPPIQAPQPPQLFSAPPPPPPAGQPFSGQFGPNFPNNNQGN